MSAATAPEVATLGALVAPRSVVVIGASSRAGHFAQLPLVNLRRFGFAGEIYAINPRHAAVADVRCYPDLGSLPETPELAVIALPAAAAVGSLAKCAAAGVKAAVVVASGFAELGESQGRSLQDEISSISRDTDIRVCGPNTLGIANFNDGIVSFASGNLAPEHRPGAVAIVSQSGGVGFTLVGRAWDLEVGVGHLAVAGNEVDVSIPELCRYYLARDDVRTVICYVEAIRDAAGLAALGRDSARSGKPVFVLKSGRTDRGQRAAQAHTGALATPVAASDAALSQWGLRSVRTVDGLINAAALASNFDPPACGLGVYCQGGGIAVIASDQLAEHGIDCPELSPATSTSIRELLPDSSASNPLDSGGQFLSRGPDPLVAALSAFEADSAIGAMALVVMPVLGQRREVYVEAFERAAASASKPYCAIQYSAGERTEEITTRLRAAGVVVLDPPEAGMEALAAWSRPAPRPEPTPRAEERSGVRADEARTLLAAWRDDGLSIVPEYESVRLLRLFQIPHARQQLASDAAQAAAVAHAIGDRVALKVASPDLPHRSDVGGIVLDLDPASVPAAYDRLLAAVATAAPGVRVVGVTVAEMVPAGIELLAGLHRDPSLGHVLAVGFGGVLAEVLDDVALRIPPIGTREAASMLAQLRGARLLGAYRGEPAIELEPLQAILLGLTALADAVGDRIRAVDLNPVIVPREGLPVAADVLVELSDD